MERDEEYQEREQQQRPVDAEVGTYGVVVDVHGDKQQQLDAELDEIGGDACQGNDQSWKVDFPEYAGIGGKHIAGYRECGIEVVPKHNPRHVEEGLGSSVGRDAGQATKHKHVHDGGEDGLDEEPQRAEDGLLIHGDNIPLDIHAVEVAVSPDAFQIDVQKVFLGLYFEGPMFVVHVSSLRWQIAFYGRSMGFRAVRSSARPIVRSKGCSRCGASCQGAGSCRSIGGRPGGRHPACLVRACGRCTSKGYR